MLTSSGWRGGRGNVQAFAGYIAGLPVGTLLTSSVLWVIAGLTAGVPPSARLAVLLAAVLVLVAREFSLVRLPLPENRRLVPIDVFARHPFVAGAQFGFEMGTGARTFVPSSAPYIVVAAITFFGSAFTTAAVAGLGFAAGRAAMPLGRLISLESENWDRGLARSARSLGRACTAAVAVAVVYVGYLLA